MAKKKNPNMPATPATPEAEPITPAPGSPQEQAGAPPEAANPVEEVAVPVNFECEVGEAKLPEVLDAEAGGEATAVNDVDKIDLADVAGQMLDATIEEPTYPAHEWQHPNEPPLVPPNEDATNEDLIEGARRLVRSVTIRLRRSVQEWWLIGRHLSILRSRPENQGRWRKEILPIIGVNHTTDHQLRAMAERMTLEQCLDFTGKTEALKSIGFFAASEPKQLAGPQAEPIGDGESKPQHEIEEIFGLGTEVTVTLDGLGEASLTQAAPTEEAEIKDDGEVEPFVGVADDGAIQPEFDVLGEAQPEATAPDKGEGKFQPKAKQCEPQTDAKVQPRKLAAKVAPKDGDTVDAVEANPQPEVGDPIAGTEALIVVLEGVGAGEHEPLVAESGLTILAKTQDQVVGVIWYAQDTFDAAREAVKEALDKLRAGKKNLMVEARYLSLKAAVSA